MSSKNADSESAAPVGNRDTEALERLLRRLRPGDQIEYRTGRVDPDTGDTIVRGEYNGIVTSIETVRGYYRVFVTGPQGGNYVIQPEKPDGKGQHPAPEAYHVSPDPDDVDYTETTEGSVLSLSLTAERTL